MDKGIKIEKYFRCQQCVYRTVRKHNLKRHVLKMHTESRRILECCGLVFQTKSDLREHLTMFHQNGYKCLICRRLFQRKALLTRHLTVHGGRKEFRCSICTYETSHKSNLQRHQNIHRRKLADSIDRNKTFQKGRDRALGVHRRNVISLQSGQISKYAETRREYSEYQMHVDFFQYSRTANLAGGVLHNDKMLPLTTMAELAVPYPSSWGWYARNNQYEKRAYLDPFVEMMATSNQLRPFYNRETNISAYRSAVREADHLTDFEQKSLVKEHESREWVQKDDGKEVESSSSASIGPPRLCHYPYKCNFCSLRFSSQHELFYHNTVCFLNTCYF